MTANESRKAAGNSSAVMNQSNAVEPQVKAYMLTRHIFNNGKIRCFKTQNGELYKVFVYCENFEGWDKYQFSQLFSSPDKALKYAFILKKKTGEAISYDTFCMLMEEKNIEH